MGRSGRRSTQHKKMISFVRVVSSVPFGTAPVRPNFRTTFVSLPMSSRPIPVSELDARGGAYDDERGELVGVEDEEDVGSAVQGTTTALSVMYLVCFVCVHVCTAFRVRDISGG